VYIRYDESGRYAMRKKELLSHVGSMQQLAYARPVLYKEGRAGGMQGYEVRNGRLSFSVMTDKCLDISEVSWKGYNMNFLSKPGLAGRNHYDTHGAEAQRSIMGGMLFTCGLENTGGPCEAGGKEYPMHGRMRTTPAEHVGADCFWTHEEDSRCEIYIQGEMREAELFGENLVLRRTIETTYQIPEIRIKDRITNEGFRDEPVMLLYHINAGYPFLDETSEIILPSREVLPRDGAAAGHTDNWGRMEAPRDNEPEYVFIHKLAADRDGNTFAAIVNEALDIGLKIQFNQKYLPYFMQWKSIAPGDYVAGLEPANSSVLGRTYHLKDGSLHILAPFETEEIELRLAFLEGGQLQEVKKEAARLLASALPVVKK